MKASTPNLRLAVSYCNTSCLLNIDIANCFLYLQKTLTLGNSLVLLYSSVQLAAASLEPQRQQVIVTEQSLSKQEGFTKLEDNEMEQLMQAIKKKHSWKDGKAYSDL